MQVRTRGRPVSVTVARLNSADAPPIFSRWEANSGFQGAGVVGVGLGVDMVCWRRWVSREVVARAARTLNWGVGEYEYCCCLGFTRIKL
jgi:hypothetical protein